jgi:NhaA family Na+:H+ antiporter
MPDHRSAQHEEGLRVPWSQSGRPVPRVVVRPLQRFLDTEVASGVVLLSAALIALIWANSPWASSYAAVWETRLELRVGGFVLSEDLRHWVNDLLMAVFFFVVGLEIKRELVHGDLREPRTAVVPVVCALGGMLVPAGLYLALNGGGPGASGWGIPMATDIAFALGVLALVGRNAPPGLRVLLLTLAIVDDIGAILVIAVFYSSGLSAGWLAVAGAAVLAFVALQRLEVRALAAYVFLAVLLWLAVYESGVHATIAGVILGLLTPAWPFNAPERVTGRMDEELQFVRALPADNRADEGEQSSLMEVGRLANQAVSPLATLETKIHPWSAYLVLPLFALANAGVPLSAEALRAALAEPVAIGVLVGLVLGKPIGVLAAAGIVVGATRAALPDGVGWTHMLGLGALAGVGFTVSIFIAGLAFPSGEVADAAKIGILAASLAAGTIGAAALTMVRRLQAAPAGRS